MNVDFKNIAAGSSKHGFINVIKFRVVTKSNLNEGIDINFTFTIVMPIYDNHNYNFTTLLCV